MIGRVNRFHGHGALNFLFKNGKTVRAEMMALRFVHGKNPDYRLSVVVSKKVSKSAVVRNRIRRRVYEVVRLTRPATANDWPIDMSITIFDDSVAEMPSEKLSNAVLQLLHKAQII